MTDTKTDNVRLPFFGEEYLYPNIFTEDERAALRQPITSDFWPVLIDLCAAGHKRGKPLYILNVEKMQRVIISDKHGFPVFYVRRTMEENNVGEFTPSYSVTTWYGNIKSRGKDKKTISSRNRQYVFKQVDTFITQMADKSFEHFSSQIAQCSDLFISTLNDETNNAGSISAQTLSPDVCYSALRIVFEDGFKQTHVPASALDKMRKVYDDLCKRYENKKSYTQRIQDYFAPEKWLLGYACIGDNRYVYCATAKINPPAPNTRTYTIKYNTDFKLYRDFDHIYSAFPDDAAMLRSALLFCKVHREKETSSAKTHDDAGFFPEHGGVYEDVGGVSYSGGQVLLLHPAWLVLNK